MSSTASDTGYTPKKFIILYVCISLAIIVIGILSFNAQKTGMIARENSELSSVVQLKVKQIYDFRKERLLDANYLFDNTTFMSTVKKYIAHPKDQGLADQLRDWLEPILKNSNYESVYLIDAHAKNVARSFGTYRIGRNEDILPVALKSLDSGKIVIGDFCIHKIDGTISLDIFIPLMVRSQSSTDKIAVVVLSIDPYRVLFDLMQSWPTETQTGEVLVVKKEGTDVLFLNELRHKKGTVLRLKLPISRQDLPAARGARGEEGIVEGLDYRGVEVLADIKRIPESEWIVVAKMDRDEILGDLKLWGVAIVGIAVVLLIILGLSFISLWRGRELQYTKSQLIQFNTIQRLNRLYEILRNINQTIVRIEDKDELLDEVCRMAVIVGKYDLCSFIALNADTLDCTPVFKYGEASEFLDGIKITTRENIPEGNGITGRAIRSKTCCVANELWNDSSMQPWKEKAIQSNLHSAISLPLFNSTSVIGTLNFYSKIDNFFIPDEIQLLGELANDLSFAIERYENEHRRKEAEESLQALTNRQDALLSSLPEIVMEVDIHKMYTWANKGGLEFFGDDVVGKEASYYFEGQQDTYSVIQPLFQGKEDVIYLESWQRRKDGQRRLLAWWCKNLKDSSGEIIGALSSARDITEPRQMEERLRRFSEVSFEGIVITERGIIVDVNSRLTEMLGYTAAEMIGQAVSLFVAPESVDIVMQHIRSGSEKPYQHLMLRKDGTTFPVEIHARNIQIENRQMRVTAILDITERKLTEEISRRTEEALARERYLMNMLMDNVPDHIYFKDLNSRFIRMNMSLAQQFGFSNPEQALGQTDFDMFTIEHARLAYEDEQSIIRTGKPIIGVEEKETWPDGSETWVSTTKMPLHDQEGKIVGTFGISRDITAHKRAEQALHESAERFQNLVQQMPVGIFLVDAIGVVVESNETYVSLTGYSKKELLAKDWIDIILPEDQSFVYKAWNEFLYRKDEFHLECRLNVPHRAPRWVIVNIIPMQNIGSETWKYLGTMIDISERKNAEQERTVLKAELAEAQKMEALGTLAGGIAHDFNNILNIIFGYADRLKSPLHSKEKNKAAIDIIIKAAERGANLVQQILMFARKKEVVFSTIELHPLVKEMTKMLNETFPKTIHIELILQKEPVFVYADVTQIYQAIINICVNARDAMLTGGALTISTEVFSGSHLKQKYERASEDSYVHLAIEDTGSGMEEAVRARIFEPFFTTKPKGAGTGLGLAVVYGIIESHHGIIDVETKLKEGTTFHLYLPEAKTKEKNIEREYENIKDIPGGSENILIIEDETLTLDLFVDVLQSKGYKVQIANNGEMGTDFFQKHSSSIDLVICDLDLPLMKGNEVVTRIKKVKPKIKVVMMSGYFDPAIRTELERLQVDDILEKPLEVQRLLKIIRKVLDQS